MMIPANELRIGNMFSVNGVVTYIHSIVSDGSGGYGYNSFEGGMPLFYEFTPIPLTSEILEKCGFYREGNIFLKCNIELHYNSEFGDYRYNRVDGGATSIQYLHEIQNLWFALKGEELPVNL